jgi:hypothetical protein
VLWMHSDDASDLGLIGVLTMTTKMSWNKIQTPLSFWLNLINAILTPVREEFWPTETLPWSIFNLALTSTTLPL